VNARECYRRIHAASEIERIIRAAQHLREKYPQHPDTPRLAAKWDRQAARIARRLAERLERAS